MKRIYIILIIVMFGLFVACENDPYLYNDVDRIWLGGSVRTDSLFYSFRLYDLDVAEAVVNVAVHLTGLPASTDRYFTLEVVDSLTNVPAEAYQIGETVFPANAYQTLIPVTIRRNVAGVDLTSGTENAKLTLRAVSGGDLEVGVEEADTYSIVWCDYLVEPESWSAIEYYIGPFSQARYKFIIDFTGYTDFSDFEYNYNGIFWLQGRLIELLEEYNADPANAGRPEGWPYLNDDGNPLQFGSGLQA